MKECIWGEIYAGYRSICDYRSREEGCVTEMLSILDLPTLQDRRRASRLTYLYKIAEGQVPALPPDIYLKKQRFKRHIRAKQFSDCVSNNIVERSVNNNTRCFVVKDCKTETYKNSFFISSLESRRLTKWAIVISLRPSSVRPSVRSHERVVVGWVMSW